MIKQYSFQLALQKFQRLYDSLGTGTRFSEAVISDSQCWDLGNFSKVRLSSLELFKV